MLLERGAKFCKTTDRSTILAFLALALIAGAASAAEQAADEKLPPTIKDFLADPTAGAVSAAGIIGLSKTVVQQIESSRDLLLAVQPFVSGDVGTGVGFAVTPGRTTIAPMSAYKYRFGGPLQRIVGSATFSVAQNTKDISSIKYKQTSYALDSSWYWDEKQDPIVVAHDAHDNCSSAEAKKNLEARTALEGRRVETPPISDEDYKKERTRLSEGLSAAYKACVKSALTELKKTAWNATRFSVSLGAGTIQAPNGGASHSLGKMLTFNGVFGPSANSAFLFSLRTVRDAVDTTTLVSTPAFKKSSLVALRYTLGSNLEDKDPNPLRALMRGQQCKGIPRPRCSKTCFWRRLAWTTRYARASGWNSGMDATVRWWATRRRTAGS